MDLKKSIQNSAFVQSFRKKDFFPLAFLDIIYYSVFIGAIAFVGRVIFPKFMQLYKAKDIFSSFQGASLDELHAAVLQVKQTYYQFWIYLVLTLLLFFFFYTFMKSYFWHKAGNQKYSWKIYWRFCLLNLILLIVFLALGLFIATVINEQNQVTIFLLILYPIMLYSLNLAHPLLVKTQNLRLMGKQMIKIGLAKIYKFIIPYVLMLLFLIILLNILLLFQLFLPDYIYYIIYLLVLVAYTTWVKLYLFEVIGRNLE